MYGVVSYVMCTKYLCTSDVAVVLDLTPIILDLP